MKKKIPTFETDGKAQDFVDTANLAEYDLSGGVPVRFGIDQAKRANPKAAEAAEQEASDRSYATEICDLQSLVFMGGICRRKTYPLSDG